MTLHARAKPNAGFTLLEALLLVIVLGVAGASTGRAITNMIHSPEQNNDDLSIETSLLDKMEYLHSLPFSTLTADVPRPSSIYTDLVIIRGNFVTRTVSIIYVVPTTGVQSVLATHVLQLTATINGKSVVTLVNEP